MIELEILEHGDAGSPLSPQEQKIVEYINNNMEADYNEIIREASWDTFYYMSSLREGLLNWYNFKENSSILEISNGFGALTGLLARACESVTVLETSLDRAQCIASRYSGYENIAIKVGIIGDLLLDEKYDYIVVEEAVNTKYDLRKLLNQICPFLKETGRLLFVCENRFGMKYWCGVPDPVSNVPFAGIRQSNTGKMVTRQDLITELNSNSWIGGFRLYYPFPDYKLPQAVYTDEYLPKMSVRDRIIPYYTIQQRNSLVCLENEICDDLIANGVFHIMANSFLVECAKTDIEADVIFAALSTDRGEEHGFATVVSAQGIVRKKTLNPAGRKSLELIYKNEKELEQRGVHCIEQTLLDTAIEMPYVHGKTMIEYLKYLFLYDNGKVEDIFDMLYQNILKSSEQVGFSECRLRHEYLTEQNAGVILAKAYIDMIPYNCFYIDGQILFYDQEFVKECFPAKYVLFRALRYTYIYIREAESIIPLQFFKEKYELCQVWQAFEEEEGRFVEDNRNYNLLSSFYRWANVSRKEIDRNIEKLRRNDNAINQIAFQYPPFRKKTYDLSMFSKDEKLNSIKRVQLQLLRRFAEVCEIYSLSYCAIYGTLLGAVRHKGYIPWDDDLDLAMPRKDYDKLVEISSHVFEEPYFLQTPENDEECFYGGYSKLRNSNTAGIEKRNQGHNCNQGIWIDIFPLDAVLKEEIQKEKQLGMVTFYQRLLFKKTYPERRSLWNLTQEQEDEYLKISKYFSREELCNSLYKAIVKQEGEKSDKIAIIARYRGGQKYVEYNVNDFEFLIEASFEGDIIPIPVGYENCLIEEYGNDYSLYPDASERKPHHIAFFDAEKSYIDYSSENEYNV